MIRNGKSKLKLSGNGNECKPLLNGNVEAAHAFLKLVVTELLGRGSHSLTSQLNLNRFSHTCPPV